MKESLLCISPNMIDKASTTKFILKKPNKLTSLWLKLVTYPLNQDLQPITTHRQLNTLLIESQIFNLNLPRFTLLFDMILNIFDKISLSKLETFLAMYKQFLSKIPETYLLQINFSLVIFTAFSEKINEKNKEAAKLIIQFVSQVNPRSGFVGSILSIS